jgi:hypothetical protein
MPGKAARLMPPGSSPPPHGLSVDQAYPRNVRIHQESAIATDESGDPAGAPELMIRSLALDFR